MFWRRNKKDLKRDQITAEESGCSVSYISRRRHVQEYSATWNPSSQKEPIRVQTFAGRQGFFAVLYRTYTLFLKAKANLYSIEHILPILTFNRTARKESPSPLHHFCDEGKYCRCGWDQVEWQLSSSPVGLYIHWLRDIARTPISTLPAFLTDCYTCKDQAVYYSMVSPHRQAVL